MTIDRITTSSWLLSGPGSTKSARTKTTTAPMTLVPIEKIVSSVWTRNRSSRGLWSADPSSRDPNGRRCNTVSALLSDNTLTVCNERGGRPAPPRPLQAFLSGLARRCPWL